MLLNLIKIIKLVLFSFSRKEAEEIKTLVQVYTIVGDKCKSRGSFYHISVPLTYY